MQRSIYRLIKCGVGRFVQDLDDLTYDGNLESYAKYLDAATPLFGSSWKLIGLPDPPSNSSKRTSGELRRIVRLLDEFYPIFKDRVGELDIDDLEDLFVDLLVDGGVVVSDGLKSLLRQLSEELTTICLFFKVKFNRPRPRQLLKRVFGVSIRDGRTTGSPSYPSAHALIGRYFSVLLSRMFPDLEVELVKLGREIGKSRVVAGFHFPSDYFVGCVLADKLVGLSPVDLLD